MPDSFSKMPTSHSTWRKTLLETPVLGTFLYNLKTHEKSIGLTFRQDFFAKPQLISSKMLDAYYEAAHMDHSHGKYLMASIEGKYIDNSIFHALKRIQIPLYIIESRASSHAVSIATTYAKQNSSIETAYISNTKLLPQLEAPDRLFEIVTMLLQKQ